MKQTEHYGLNQWDLSDRIRMEDFNADNAKLAAQLARLQEDIFGLTYYIGQTALYFQLNGQQVQAQYPIASCIFHPKDQVITTGDVVVADNCATLTGQGAKGSVTFKRSPFLIQGIPDKGQEIRLWLHYSGGTVRPFFNDVEMETHGRFMDHTVTKRDLMCDTFSLKAPFASTFSLRLDLDCGSSSQMVVYDLVLAQL